jgi:hypothetical protein
MDFEGFFFERVWSLDTSFEDVCVVQNSGCKFCVRKEATNKWWWVCSETQKTQEFEAWFLLGFRV